MRKALLSFLILCLALFGCEELSELMSIKTSFDAPFPGRPKNLTHLLGHEFILYSNRDTTSCEVQFDKANRSSLITTKNNDTLFYGTVSTYKQLYFFNQPLTDSTYWIYAVEKNNDQLKGLREGVLQMFLIDNYFDQENDSLQLSQKLNFRTTNTGEKLLTPEKKTLYKLYYSYLQKVQTDTLLSL